LPEQTKLDSAARKTLEELALERLNATVGDDAPWSFLFRTDGAVNLLYCPWSATEEWEFDGETEGLDLPWSPHRLELIEEGDVEPNDEELRQWRQAMARKLAAGSGWSWSAWMVPLRIERETAGYALFVSDAGGDPGDSPMLKGIFTNLEEAKAALRVIGAVAEER
jgi:hypothetical protein